MRTRLIHLILMSKSSVGSAEGSRTSSAGGVELIGRGFAMVVASLQCDAYLMLQGVERCADNGRDP
jgi:hypothetical protein